MLSFMKIDFKQCSWEVLLWVRGGTDRLERESINALVFSRTLNKSVIIANGLTALILPLPHWRRYRSRIGRVYPIKHKLYQSELVEWITELGALMFPPD